MTRIPTPPDIMVLTLLRQVEDKIETLQRSMGEMKQHLSLVDDRLTAIHGGMIHLTDRMDRLIVRLDSVDDRLKILPVKESQSLTKLQH